MAKVRGLSFSLKRAIGITAIKKEVADKTGIPTTRGGLERKIGRKVLENFEKQGRWSVMDPVRHGFPQDDDIQKFPSGSYYAIDRNGMESLPKDDQNS